MKVRILSGVCGNPWNLAHFPGDVVDLAKPLALELIEAKAAEKVGAAAGAKEETKEPAAPASEKATAKAPAKAEKATKK